MSKWSLSLGAIAGLATGMAMAVALPAHCRDGWASGSIGRPGACSWHGGVSHAGDFLALIAGVAVALLVMYAVYGVEKVVLPLLGEMLAALEELLAALGKYARRLRTRDILWLTLAASLFALSALRDRGFFDGPGPIATFLRGTHSQQGERKAS
jgi:hypothetical protein